MKEHVPPAFTHDTPNRAATVVFFVGLFEPIIITHAPRHLAKKHGTSYTVLPVDGRTAIDVVPPATVSFVESLITVRSDLDPFLHAEALTYTPRQGGAPPGGDIGEDAGSGGGGTDAGKGVDPGAGGGTVSGGGGGGGEFLTFGLSSWSSAVVGCTFLVVGLLLLLQPTLVLRRWWRRTAAADGGVVGGGGGGSDGGVVGVGGRGEKRPRGKQWSYGQVDSQW